MGDLQYCEICEQETEWNCSKEFGEHDWCKSCGISKEMLDGVKAPGGCEQHPDATHEFGFGLAGGGMGNYSICNECCAIFDVERWPEDAA